ncbi:MAG TPA: hypothetical protein PLZ32_15085 [Saprospiraceae bacterium]|nr:hypothetical protein [Saprospiraceae bacterium]
MDNRYNGFKELEQSIIDGKGDQFSQVKNNLQANKGSFDFIGNLVTLYLPQVMEVIGRFLGTDSKK